MDQKPILRVPVRRSNDTTPTVKPIAVRMGANNHRASLNSWLLTSTVKRKAAIQTE